MIKFLRGYSFIKNVSTLMTGTGAAQVITIIVAPILSRLYDPEAFGVFALYTSIVSVLAVIMTWRYELAIVLPKKDEDAANLLILSGLIVLKMTILLSLFIIIFKEKLEIILGVSQLDLVLLWVPISICALGFYQSFNYWSTRKKSYKRLAISQLFRSSSVVTTQLIGGLLKIGSTGLVFGQALGHIVATIVLGKQILKDDKKIVMEAFNSYTFGKFKTLIKEYSDFPKYSMPEGFVNSISQNVVPFILTLYFNPAVVGFYAISFRLLQLPVNLIGNAVKQVFYQRAVELYNNGQNLRKYLVTATIMLSIIFVIPSSIILIFGPTIFSFVLGDNWNEAGVYARWMIIWLFFVFITRPTIAIFQALRLYKEFLTLQVINLLLSSISLILVSHYFNSPLISIATYSLINSLFFSSLLVYGLLKSKIKIKSL